jgi:hypothetical protein
MPYQPEKDSKTHPFGEEEAILARKSWIQANMTPKAAILAGKLGFALSLVLNLTLAYGMVKVSIEHGKTRPIVIRINDVGRAEVVRLDTDYIPNEPELRSQIERFVIRYYTRNGFEVPEALDALPAFMDGPIYDTWRKEAMASLTDISKGEGLRRVRILSCSVLYPHIAKTTGTTATLRIATDEMTPTGAFIAGKSQGWEINLRFKTGIYPDFQKNEAAKDAWCTRNPLGTKILDIQRIRYNGADVEDQKMERAVEVIRQRTEEEFKHDQLMKQQQPR